MDALASRGLKRCAANDRSLHDDWERYLDGKSFSLLNDVAGSNCVEPSPFAVAVSLAGGLESCDQFPHLKIQIFAMCGVTALAVSYNLELFENSSRGRLPRSAIQAITSYIRRNSTCIHKNL